MKKTIKLAVVAALALGATSVFATNGSTMIGMGAKTRGMGGTGIGVGHGAESALSNPALITTIKSDNEISFGGTLFMPDIETTNGMMIPTGPAGAAFPAGATGVADFSGTAVSDSDMFVIPSVSVANKVSNNFYWGVGMWGTGGLGVDYRKDASHMNMVTALQLMQFGVPLVYTSNDFSVGITPILQYGSLDINYVMSPELQNAMYGMGAGTFGGATNPMTIGSGVADDLRFGYNLGLSYKTGGLTLGAVYISEIEMEYEGVMSTAIGAMTGGAYKNDKLSSPSQYGAGASYKIKEHTVALDYKHINWEDAEGYKDFEWQDQDVIALGYEYATKGWALRAGYEYAESAVQNQTFAGANSAGLSSSLVNTFNLLGFPGTQETHVTFGGTYAFNEKLSLDLAVVYGLENEETMPNFLGQNITTKHSEQGYSFQLNYNF